MNFAGALFVDSLLQDKPAVVLGFCRFDVKGGGFGELMELFEDAFELICTEQVVQLAASGGDQEEDAPERDAKLLHERHNLIDFSDVATAKRGVDLDRKADLVGPADCVEGAGEGT